MGSAGASVTFTPAQVPGPGHRVAVIAVCTFPCCAALFSTCAQLFCMQGTCWDDTDVDMPQLFASNSRAPGSQAA